MTMALYYPHTDIQNITILKNALLLWDGLETISPTQHWHPRRFDDAAANEALDMLVKPKKPSETQKKIAHKALSEIHESGQIESIIREWPELIHRKSYMMYPEKFLSETWYMLKNKGMAHWSHHEDDWGVPAALGFLMMSLLADACAGTQKLKVTDRADAYSWLAERTAQTLRHPQVGFHDNMESYDRLISISLDVLDARDIPLSDLVDFRKRELKTSGSDYAEMRKKYRLALDAHLKKIGSEARDESDIEEMERQFKRDLELDLSDLKKELNQTSLKTLFSKDVATSILCTAGSALATIPTFAGIGTTAGIIGAAGVIPLVSAARDLRGARRTAFQKHTSSWLYLTNRKGLQIR